jgi:hypothetical protein
MPVIQKLALPFIYLACIGVACADEDSDLFLLDIQQLLDIEVSTATKRQHKVENTPSIVTVFTHNDIQKMGVTSMIDVLKHAPGFETSMDPDGHWRVSLRGMRNDGTILLLIDGLPLNDFYDGRADFDLPLGLIKQVEIIRGPGSALYGTNAVAGVINVITNKVGSKATVKLQSNQGFELSGHHQFNFDEGTLGVNLGYLKSDGANVTDNQDVDPADAGTTNRHIQKTYLSSTYKGGDLQLDLLALQSMRGPWVGPGLLYADTTQINRDHYQVNAKYDWQIRNNIAFLPWLGYDSIQYNALNEDVPPGLVILRNAFPDGGYTKEDYKTSTLGLGFDMDMTIHDTTKILTGISYQDMSMENYQLVRNYQVIGFIPQSTFANHDNLNYEQREQGRKVRSGGQVTCLTILSVNQNRSHSLIKLSV